MSEERLKWLIEDFSHRNLNLFFLDRCENYAETQEELSQYDDERFGGFQKLGEIRFDDGERLVVIASRVSGDLSERSGKRAQYEKAKRILKEVALYDAGFFVFYDDLGSFRFSLVYGQAEGTRRSWSNFRRFTYFVSREQTNRTFRVRVGGCSFVDLEAIKDAFSVEKVTKEFYRQIADWYFWAVQNVTFPKDAEAEENGRNIAVIRLITRLIFIWFMKQRKLVSPDLFDKETVRDLLVSLHPQDTTYYKAILQNLFFATLNTKIDEREFRFTRSYHGRNTDYMNHGIYRYEDYFRKREDMLVLFKDIPFLNGGLFDCLDWSARESGMSREVRFDGFSDREVGLSVPNYLFFSGEMEANLNAEYGTKNKRYRVQGLLNILWAYNFTIDENDPIDQEVALDPELLGKVFENLLASFNPETATTARKATGSYYTPREIVDYMVTQSLKQYYRTYLSDVDDIDEKLDELLAPITAEEQLNPFGADDSARIVRLTEELRVVDPAVGSGAFPMGILNKLVSVLARVDPDNRLWQQAQLKGVEGVTDPLLKHKLAKQIDEQFSERKSNYGRKLYLIQKCIYGVDIQQIAVEIAKLRFFIALLVDERIDTSKPNWGIEPLPNLDFKIMQGNSLISEFVGVDLDIDDLGSYGKLMKDETEELISEYRSKKTDYQYEPDRAKRDALKQDIDILIVRIFESKLQSEKAEYLTKLRNIGRKYADLPDTGQRQEAVKKDIATLNQNYGFDLSQAERQLKEFTSGLKVRPFFAWKLYFAEVFHEKGGFDIVIANPPYLSAWTMEKQDPGARDKIAAVFDSYNVLTGHWDLYMAFVLQGHNLLRKSGVLSYILPNPVLREKYATALRRFLLEKMTMDSLLVFDESNVFADVSRKTAVLVVTNDTNQHYSVKVRENSLWEQDRNSIRYCLDINKDCWLHSHSCRFRVDFDERQEQLLTRLDELSLKVGNICYVNYGAQVSSKEKGLFQKSDVVRYEPLGNAKRFYEGKDLHRWSTKWRGLWLDYRKGQLYGPRTEQLFECRKIAIRHVSDKHHRLGGTLDETGMYCDHGIVLVVPYSAIAGTGLRTDFVGYEKIEADICLDYVAAHLLSSLSDFYYRSKFATESLQQATSHVYPQAVRALPVKGIPRESQTPFIYIVGQILGITRDEDYLSNPTKQAAVKELEHQIDQMIYQLYDLTPEEIAVVEGALER